MGDAPALGEAGVVAEPHGAQADLGRREAELRSARRANLEGLRERGADPFAATRYAVTAHAAELAERYAGLTPDAAAPPEPVAVAGRLMSVRTMGKGAIFADLWDRTGRLQLYVRKDAIGEDAFALFGLLDLGDIAGATGTMFRSKTGELTLRVLSFAPLSKSLVPLPDKWHGLQDVEKRYRQRYVDLMMNEHVRAIFLARSKIVSEMRRFCDAKGFIENETPTMRTIKRSVPNPRREIPLRRRVRRSRPRNPPRPSLRPISQRLTPPPAPNRNADHSRMVG